MKRAPALPGGELEYAILSTLWELGAASAGDIHARVGKPDKLVYTTTAKILDRLHDKRLVARELVGKAFVYRPAVDREVVERGRAAKIVGSLLGRAPRPALATLVEAVEELDPELLDELARVVARRRRSRRDA